MRKLLQVGLAAFACVGFSSGALAASDRQFLVKAMKGDNSEMSLGRVAERRGASAGVRRFGAMLVRDHAHAKAQALPVARAHGIRPTSAMLPEARAEARKLSHLRGARFDHEFARYMVNDHRKDIADFQQEARTGDRRTAALARQTLPTLRKHLRVAQSLAS